MSKMFDFHVVTLSALKPLVGAALVLLSAACGGTSESVESDLRAKKDEMEGLTSLSYEGATTTLNFGYVVSGGCAEHRASASLTLHGDVGGNIQVFDSVNGQDMCEALLHPEGTVVLSDLLRKSVGGRGDGRTYEINVPPVFVPVAQSGSAIPPEPRSFPIQAVKQLSLDASGQLHYAFVTSGGCGMHHPGIAIELSLPRNQAELPTAKVSITDASDDMCEALIPVEGTVDLSKALYAAFHDKGVAIPPEAKVELPAVEAQILE